MFSGCFIGVAIQVRGIDEDTVESSNEFTALTQALVKVNVWEFQFEDNYNN